MSTVDKFKNEVEKLEGKGHEALGKATDDKDLEAQGKGEQGLGDLKQAGEKVKDAFRS